MRLNIQIGSVMGANGRAFVFFFFSVLSLSALHGASVQGRILAASDSLPVPGVQVRALGNAKRATVTDAKGIYRLELPDGEYQLTTTMLGLKSEGRKIGVRGSDVIQNFLLYEESQALGEVVVSAAKLEQLKRVETGVQRLTSKEIAAVPPMFGEIDLIKAIQMLPGVQPISEGTSAFSVRGGTSAQNLILLDGTTVYNATHLMGFFSVFNNDVIRDLTLYKGDLPAAHGGRLSSLLDVQTQESVDRSFQLQGGVSLLASRLTLSSEPIKGLSVYVGGRRTYADVFLPLAPVPEAKDSKLFFYDLNAGVSWTINPRHRLSFSAYTGEDQFGNETMGDMKFGNSTLSLKWNAIWSEKLTSQFQVGYAHYGYRFASDMMALNAVFASKVQDTGLRYGFTWLPNEKHEVRWGINSKYYWFDPSEGSMTKADGSVESRIVPRKRAFDVSLYGEEVYRLNNRFSLRLGLRYTNFFNLGPEKQYLYDEQYNEIGLQNHAAGSIFNRYDALEPRFGLVYQPTVNQSIKLGVNRNVQFLHLISSSFAGTPMDFWMPSTVLVPPQTLWQYAVGYQYFTDNGVWEFSADAYYKDFDQVVDYKDHPSIFMNEKVEADLRVGHGYGYGVELMAKKVKGIFTGWVSYAFSHSYQQVKDANNGNWYRSPADRPHQINVVLNCALTDRWSVSGTWMFVSGQPVTLPEGRMLVGGSIVALYGQRNSYRLEDYHRLDLGATFLLNKPNDKKRWRHELSLSIYNVYNRYNTWYINYTEEPRGSGKLYADKVYLFPIIPSIAYNFKF